MFESIGVDFGRRLDGAFIDVQAVGGKELGRAEVEWRDEGNGEYLLIIRIPLEYLRDSGVSGKVEISWGTAFCGNSPVAAECDLFFPTPGWGGGGPGYIPPANPSASAIIPSYVGGLGAGGFSCGGGGGGASGGGGDSPPEYSSTDHPPDTPPATPIPGTVILLASGLAVLLGWRKMRGN